MPEAKDREVVVLPDVYQHRRGVHSMGLEKVKNLE